MSEIGKPVSQPSATAKKPKRPEGRSLTDFRIKAATTAHKLLPAEKKLLHKARMGKPCRLKPNRRKAVADRALARIADPAFYAICVEVMKRDPSGAEPPADLLALEKAEDRIVQPFFAELRRYARGHPETPAAWDEALAKDAEALRPVFDECRACFIREVKGWRSVDITDKDVLVRGAFVRFLALGGDDKAPVHERGVQLEGAWIAAPRGDDKDLGVIDLSYAVDVRPLSLKSCRVRHAPKLDHARCHALLALTGSRVPGLGAEGARIAGNVLLDDGFRSGADVAFVNAEIKGRLTCSGGSFLNRSEDGKRHALNAGRVVVTKDVTLDDGFRAEGKVCIHGAGIGGDLDCSGGRFLNRTLDGSGIALFCDGIAVTGDVIFTDGFRAEGEVSLRGAHVSDDLDCRKGTFISTVESGAPQVPCPPREKIPDVAPLALNLENAEITGGFILSESSLHGSIDLTAVRCGHLIDGSAKWPLPVVSDRGKAYRCDVKLDGLTYGQFSGSGRISDAEKRKQWLERQPPEHLESDFRPQPWEQLIKVYRAMGHEFWTRDISKEKQKHLHNAKILWLKGQRRRPLEPGTTPVAFYEPTAAIAWSYIHRVVLGYGYGGRRLTGALLLILLVCAEIYSHAAKEGLFVPKTPIIIASKAKLGEPDSVPLECRVNWTTCQPPALPREYPRFNAFVYSADLIFPLVSFGQEDAWGPISTEPDRPSDSVRAPGMPWWFLRFVTWAEVVLGWALSFLLVAVLSGVMKKE